MTKYRLILFGVINEMKVRYINTVAVAMAFSAYSLAVHSNEMNGNAARQGRMAQQPTSDYWQAPNWPNFSAAPARSSRATEPARPPARNNIKQNNNYRSHPRSGAAQNDRQPNDRAPNYRQSSPSNQYPVRNNNRQVMNQPDRRDAARPPLNANRGNTYPSQRGPNSAPNMPKPHMNQYRQGNAAPAYNNPGYRPSRPNNGWNPNARNNRFWGNSGPNRWMNPNKGNMGRGWNDMTNGPGRMGEMPGGWRAPEVSLPNPVDVGDQVQGNVKDLPEQMRNMDVGNN